MVDQHVSSFGRSFLDRTSNEIVRDSPLELQVYQEQIDHEFHQIEACFDMNHRCESLPADFLTFQLSKFLNFRFNIGGTSSILDGYKLALLS